MPTSGVPKRARSVAMRRSQLAANSSAPPMQTPSMAASTGIGAASVTSVTRWKARTVAAQDSRRGVDRGEEVVAGGEVLAGAARDHAAHRLVGARGLDAVGDRLDRVARPRVAIGLAVPGHHPRRSQLAHRHTHASTSSSPRAVRYTTRVFCSPTGSAPGATACTSKRAPSSARSAASTPSTPSASRRRPAAAGRSGRPRPPPHSGPAGEAPEHRADRARVHVDRLDAQHVVDAALDADPHPVRPHAHGDVHTRARSPER